MSKMYLNIGPYVNNPRPGGVIRIFYRVGIYTVGENNIGAPKIKVI